MDMSLSLEQRELWNRIRSFPLDGACKLPTFTRRLAAENDWSLKYTALAIREYRRFLFLTMVADHTVTPSVDVDRVWHLHLTYTRAYWDHLCGEILGRPLHHDPSTGGATETAKYSHLYRTTLESYERLFGEAPPQAIWPSPTERFSPEAQVYSLSKRTHILIRKPTRATLAIWVGTVLCTLWAFASAIVAICVPHAPRIWHQFAFAFGATILLACASAIRGLYSKPERMRRRAPKRYTRYRTTGAEPGAAGIAACGYFGGDTGGHGHDVGGHTGCGGHAACGGHAGCGADSSGGGCGHGH